MLSAFTPSPMAVWLMPMPVSLPRAASARACETSFTCTCFTRGRKRWQKATGSLPAMKELPVSKFRPKWSDRANSSMRAMASGLVVK